MSSSMPKYLILAVGMQQGVLSSGLIQSIGNGRIPGNVHLEPFKCSCCVWE